MWAFLLGFFMQLIGNPWFYFVLVLFVALMSAISDLKERLGSVCNQLEMLNDLMMHR